MFEQPLLKNFFHFLKKPNPDSFQGKSTVAKIFILIRIYAFEIAIAMLLAIAISILLNAINYSIEKNSVSQFVMTQNIFSVILLSVIIAPLIEEVTFRLVLKYSAVNFSIFISLFIRFFISVLSIFGVDIFQKFREIFKNISSFEGLIWNVLAYVFFLVIFPFLIYQLIRKLNQQKLKNFWQKRFGYIFYGITILFSALHIFNYDDLSSLNLYVIILVLPQLVAGLSLGFIRVRLGLRWSVLLHMMHNASGILPIALLTLVSPKLSELLGSGNSQEILKLPPTDQLKLTLIGLIIILGIVFILAINLYNFIDLSRKKPQIN